MKLALTLLVFLAAITSTQARACICAPGETEHALEKAEMAWVGRPVRIEVVPPENPATTVWMRMKDSVTALFPSLRAQTRPAQRRPAFLGTVRVTFEVSEYTKGNGPKQLQVMTGYGESDCGLPVSISKKYTIYARRVDGALRTSYCFGSAEYVPGAPALPCSGH